MNLDNIDDKCPINSWFLRLMHQYSAINFKRFMDMGVHPGQIPVLRAVHEHAGISLREMAEKLHVKPPTVTVTVKRLEKAGFLYREPDWRDSRVSRIYETEKGKELSREIGQQVCEREVQLLDGFSEEEKAQLCDFFRRMSENLVKEGAPCVPGDPEAESIPCMPEKPEEECITLMPDVESENKRERNGQE